MNDYNTNMKFLFYHILPYPDKDITKNDENIKIFILLAQKKLIIQVT
jgi:hypothetical protein